MDPRVYRLILVVNADEIPRLASRQVWSKAEKAILSEWEGRFCSVNLEIIHPRVDLSLIVPSTIELDDLGLEAFSVRMRGQLKLRPNPQYWPRTWMALPGETTQCATCHRFGGLHEEWCPLHQAPEANAEMPVIFDRDPA